MPADLSAFTGIVRGVALGAALWALLGLAVVAGAEEDLRCTESAVDLETGTDVIGQPRAYPDQVIHRSVGRYQPSGGWAIVTMETRSDADEPLWQALAGYLCLDSLVIPPPPTPPSGEPYVPPCLWCGPDWR